MLNITENSISDSIRLQDFKSYALLRKSKVRRLSILLFTILLFGLGLCLFLPWTQNISAKGHVTTRSPEQRPQAIQSIIAGRLEKWFIQEGDFVARGDTIAFLSEVKSEYFDPDLIARTSEQVEAKSQSIQSYGNKVKALQNQFAALEEGLQLKREQIMNKMIQARNKITMDSMELTAYQNNYQVADNQLSRIRELHGKGLKTLSELQEKELKLQASRAKVTVQRNKLLNQKNALDNLNLELSSAERDYADKLAKSQSDRQSAISAKLESVAATSKLQNQLSNYNERQKLYYITAPQSGYITKTIKKGIGESLKAGADVATIMPDQYDLAVEIYLKPQDLPLLSISKNARLRFDGWPAIVISGWPESSTGIFSGTIVAVNRTISDNGFYQVLISPDNSHRAWPEELRVGVGVNAFIILEDVPMWYEIWRQLNGFPPEFYKKEEQNKTEIKRKSPIKSIK